MIEMVKQMKDDVSYTIIPRKDGATCGETYRCRAFQAVNGAHGDGLCDWVHGIILRRASCDLHEPADSSVKGVFTPRV